MYGRHRCMAMGSKLFSLILVLPIATIIIFIAIFYVNSEFLSVQKLVLVFGAVLLLISNSIMFFIFGQLLNMSEKSRKIERAYVKRDMERKYFQHLEKVNEEHRALLHDINKYLRTAAELIQKGNVRDGLEIFFKADLRLQETKRLQYSEHKILNAVLCERRGRAEEWKVDYRVEIEKGINISFIDDMDLIAILGNLIDNALEAASQLQEGAFTEIRMFMANQYHLLVMEIRNNYLTPPKMGRDGYITSKENKRVHGIGIHTVNRLLWKYGSTLRTETSCNEFLAEIVWSIPR